MTRFLLPILMFVAAGGLFFGFVTTRYEGVKALRAEAAQYDEALERAQELRQVRDRLNATYRTFSTSDVESLLMLLPDNLDNIRFALDIDRIAVDNNLKISKLELEGGESEASTPEGEEPQDESLTLGMATLRFTVEGSYANMVNFLMDLERNLRVVDITDITFMGGEAGGPESYTIGVRMYWLK